MAIEFPLKGMEENKPKGFVCDKSEYDSKQWLSVNFILITSQLFGFGNTYGELVRKLIIYNSILK